MKRNTRKASKRAKATKQPSAKRTRPASQTTPTKKSAPTQPPAKAYILAGADEYAKPRAARFSGEDPALLAKAAEAMHLRLIEITEPEVAEIAALLPAGRLHANGKGLVPYVKGGVYSELLFAALAPLPPQINADPLAARPAAYLGRPRARPSRDREREPRTRLVGSGRDRADR